MAVDDPQTIDETAVEELIRTGLAQLPLSIPADAVPQLVRLVSLLSQWAGRMNLTGHRDPLEMTTRLVLDAAALTATLPELADARDLADLGSGAGFPGLPIAILHPRLRVFLVESRQRRHHFQKEARRKLGLDLVTPILGRSDAVETRACSVVVAQAMAQPEQAVEHMTAWAEPRGLIVLPASERAERPKLPPSLELEQRSYHVPLSAIERRLWLIRRV